MLRATTRLDYRTFWFVSYGMGLRLGETLRRNKPPPASAAAPPLRRRFLHQGGRRP
jgi:hypothetical protein